MAGTFFDVLGAAASIGRVLTPHDEAADARVTVVAHSLWIRRFGGDPRVIGRQVILNGASYTVVGVLPAGFLFPFRYAELAVPLPLRDDRRRSDRGANFLRVIARLRPGVTFAQANADLDTIARRLQRQFPDDDARKTGVNLYPLHAEIGVVGSALFAPILVGRVFATSVWDPATYAAVAVALLVVGAVASYLPTGRAADADPAALLR